MFDQYLQQLNSNDPAERRAAIVALAKSGDSRALKPLSNVIKTDPDESLRALAMKAGRHLRGLDTQITLPAPGEVRQHVEHKKRATSTANLVFTELPDIDAPAIQLLPGMISQTPAFTQVPATSVEKPRRVTSAQDKRLAKGKLDQAIGLKMEGDNEKARVALVEAVRRDPDLANDVVALNMASNVTDGKSPTEAMVGIVRDAESGPAQGGGFSMPNLRNAQGSVDPAVWNLALEIGIFIVISVLFGVVLNLGLSNMLTSLLRMSRTQTEETIMAQEMLRSLTPAVLFLQALKSGTILAITTVFALGVSYIVGAMRGGSGDMFHFLSALIRVRIVFNILQILFLGVVVAGFLMPVNKLPNMPLVGIGGFLFLFSFFIQWLAMGVYAARAHEFSFLRGLTAISAGTFLAGILWSVFGVFNG